MTDSEEGESNNTCTTSGGNPTGSGTAGSSNPNSGNPSGGNNEESLGEIWFDTMRRTRGQGNGSNTCSTPSSPTGSSEQDENGDGDPEGEGSDIAEPNLKHDSQQVEPSKQQAAKRPRATGGYQSDDEGFNFNGTSTSASDESNNKVVTGTTTSTNNNTSKTNTNNETAPTTTAQATSPSYLDAVTLMVLHKKAQQEEMERLQQQQQQQQDQKPQLIQELEPKLKKQKTEAETNATGAKTLNATDSSNTKDKTPSTDTTSSPTPPANNTSTKKELSKLQQRLERNAREKERSGKITDMFHQLKQILTEAGVVVPKGTKGSILTIAHQYILNMQQQQRQKLQDNQNLKQQILNIANGSLGSQTAQALHMAAQKNGVTQQVPIPPSDTAMTTTMQQQKQKQQQPPPFDPLTVVQHQDYHRIWDSCPVGIAIATMGGTFLDCNQVFTTLLKCSKAQLKNVSIFHLLDPKPATEGGKSNLQMAFERISQLLETLQATSSSSSEEDNSSNNNKRSDPIILPGAIQGHARLGLGVSLIQSVLGNTNGLDGHHLCVTLLEYTGRADTTTATSLFPTNSNSSSSSNSDLVRLHPATLVALPPPRKTVPLSQPNPIPTQQQPQPQHALKTILTNSAPISTTASSSLSSSGSSDQNPTKLPQQQQQQQQQLPTDDNLKQQQQHEQNVKAGADSSRYYTVG